MPFSAILFDLDGTLLDTLADLGASVNRVLQARGYPAHAVNDYRQMVGEGASVLIGKALPPDRRDAATIAQCLDDFARDYADHWHDATQPYPGITELLDELTKRELKLAVLSNKPDRFTQLCVREFFPRWTFPAILGATADLPRKPDPAGALEIARRLSIPPQNFLYLGDSGIDMQTATAAEMFPVGALWGFRGREELQAAGARALIKRPIEAIDLISPRKS